jgi:hypothetical protein
MSGLSTGAHRGIPAAQYHAMPFASASRLKVLKDSCPAALRYKIDHPQEPTPDMLMGTATHDMVLDNVDRVLVAGKCAGRLVKGGKCGNNGKHLYRGEWYCGVHWFADATDEAAGKSILTADQHASVIGMAGSIRANPDTRKYLDHREETELSLVWDDPEMGCRCKARIDLLSNIDGRYYVADLKTTTDASPAAFAKAIKSLNYHLQASFYRRGLAVVMGIYDAPFVFMPVEKTKPHLCAAYTLNEPSLISGDEEAMRLLAVWKRCQDTGEWPGYAPQEIGLSEFDLRKSREA